MSYLDRFFTLQIDGYGVAYPNRPGINFIGGTVADNPITNKTDVTIGGAGLIPPHNDLFGLEKYGSDTGYYHLSSPQLTWLLDGINNDYWVATKGGTGLKTYTTGDIIYCDSTNHLAKLPIGADGYTLTSNGTLPAWAIPPATNPYVTTINVGKSGKLDARSFEMWLLPNFNESETSLIPCYLVNTSGLLKDLRIYCNTPPGSGNTTEIFVYLNGSVTTLATSISDTTQTAYVDSSVAVSAGDKISISIINYTGSLTADLYVALNLVVA